MKELLKYILIFLAMIIAAFYIYQMVMNLSPSTDIFAPR